MAGSIENRIVQMTFDNAKFEAGIAQTINSLAKLDTSLQKIGTVNGLANIQAAADKLNFAAAGTSAEQLKGKIAFSQQVTEIASLDAAAHKVTFAGIGNATEAVKAKMASISGAAVQAFAGVSAAADKISFGGLSGAIDRIQAKLSFSGSNGVGSGIASISAQASKVDLSPISAQTQKVQASFSAMQAVAFAAIGGITTKAMTLGKEMLNQVAGINAVKEGFADYELKIGATQTIMSGTGEGIKTVTKNLKDLDIYADETIYSLSDMTSNIGKFTNAGVKLPVAVSAMKGIANVAALSGASSGEAARAMYNLGQAIGQGTVKLMDWKSVELANMGTKEFKEQLIEAAVATGSLTKASDGSIKTTKGTTVTYKNFSQTLQDGWLSSEALTKSLGNYADKTTKIGKKAYAAATEVKTFSMLMETLTAAIGTGWTDTFETILGDLPEATKLWTSLSESIGGAVGKSADMRNAMLKQWDQLGGRTKLIEALKTTFSTLGAILKPIREAFREIFPRTTAKDLIAATAALQSFAEGLRPSAETADKMKRTFQGLFAILSIGKQVMGAIIGFFFDLVGAVGKSSGGILGITAAFGDWLTSIDKGLKKGEFLATFFRGLGDVLAFPIKLLGDLGALIGGLFSGKDVKQGETLKKTFAGFKSVLEPLRPIIDGFGKAWDKVKQALRDVGAALEPAISQVGESFANFGELISNVIETGDYEKVFSAIQTVLIGGIFLAIRKGLKGGMGALGIDVDIGGGGLKALNGTFKALTGNLTAMQQNIQAGTLLKIATALLALASAVKILASIDSKSLSKSMTAISIGFGQLMGAMFLLTRTSGGLLTATVAVPAMAVSMNILAASLIVLAGAVKLFSMMSWEELGRGLAGVAGSMVILGTSLRLFPAATMLPIAAGLLPIAVAMNILAVAMKMMATMSWEDIAQGLAGIGGGLVVIAGAMRLMPLTMTVSAVGIGVMAVSLNALSIAVMAFGGMDLISLAKGLGGIAGSMAAMALGLKLMPTTLVAQAAAITVVGVALNVIALAVRNMGSIPLLDMAKGIGAIGLSLAVIAKGLKGMTATVAGSAALLGAAVALNLLVPAIGILGAMKLETLAKGIASLAAILLVMGKAGGVAAPGIGALGTALLPFAAAAVGAGAAAYLLGKGFELMGSNGAKGTAAMIAAITALLIALPAMVISFTKGLVQIIAEVAKLAPQVVDSIVKIIHSILDVVIKASPKLAAAITALIKVIVDVIMQNTVPIINAGMHLLLSLLKGIDDNIVEVTKRAASIIVKFLGQLASEVPRLVAAGANLLIKFLNGIARETPKMIGAAAKAIVAFLKGIADNVGKVVKAAADIMVKFLKAIADSIPRVLAAGTRIITKFLEGVGNMAQKVIRAGVNMIGKFMDGISKAIPDLVDRGFKAVIRLLNGMAKSIRDNDDQLIDAFYNLGGALVDGLVKGLASLPGRVLGKLKDGLGSAVSGAKKFLGINSPSKVFIAIGESMGEGAAKGAEGSMPLVTKAVNKMAGSAVDVMRAQLSAVPDILDGIVDMDPVISPVLDLTNVEAEAKRMADMTNVTPITAAASFKSATAIAAEKQLVAEGNAETEGSNAPVLNFKQENHSPKALSESEVYRNTNNQLSQAKSMLDDLNKKTG